MFRYLIVVFMLLLTGCAEQRYEEEFRVLLLSECQDSALSHIRWMETNFRVDGEIVLFDDLLDSQASAIGYVRLSSSVETKEQLQNMANRFILDCYPLSSVSVAVNESESDRLSTTIRRFSDLGVDNFYLVWQADGQVSVYMNQTPFVER